MSRRATAAWVLGALHAACATTSTFRDQPIVWRVSDSQDIPEPEEIPFLRMQYFANIIAMERLTRTLEVHDQTPAQNTNALDEVPDSSWFTNRIGVRPVSPQEAARGPGTLGPPVPPLTVVGGKGGGANPGFLAKDSTGRTFVVKFDTKNNPEMQTATSVIVSRFFWTAGYNVPADYNFSFRPEDLRIAPDAMMRDGLGTKTAITEEVIRGVLRQSPRLADGSFRSSASQFLTGIPKGGFTAQGIRPDDANDTIAHEHRRELRGIQVLAAWLGHTDMKDDNTLDMYVEEGGRHFIRHYLVDFGEALGAHQAEKIRYEDGWEHLWDWRNNLLALFAFGLWKRPWEDQEDTKWLSIGAFGAEHFQPELWREAYPYWPFFEADAADRYWGAKLVMKFDRPLIEAIVGAGNLTDPQAAAYLVDALVGRQQKIGQAWLEAVTPLDYFTMKEGSLCAIDLGVRFGLAVDGVVERLPEDYWPVFDDDKPEQERKVEEFRVAKDGTVCMPTSEHDDYTVDRLRIRRGKSFKPVMQVHYKAGETPRLLGIIRVEP